MPASDVFRTHPNTDERAERIMEVGNLTPADLPQRKLPIQPTISPIVITRQPNWFTIG